MSFLGLIAAIVLCARMKHHWRDARAEMRSQGASPPDEGGRDKVERLREVLAAEPQRPREQGYRPVQRPVVLPTAGNTASKSLLLHAVGLSEANDVDAVMTQWESLTIKRLKHEARTLPRDAPDELHVGQLTLQH